MYFFLNIYRHNRDVVAYTAPVCFLFGIKFSLFAPQLPLQISFFFFQLSNLHAESLFQTDDCVVTLNANTVKELRTT